MRRFHSYGPIDPEQHYSVPRAALIEQCVNHLVGDPGKGGRVQLRVRLLRVRCS